MYRWKNYGLWISLFALVNLILKTYGLFEYMGLTEGTFSNIITALLSFLVAAGIISNPTDSNGYTNKNL